MFSNPRAAPRLGKFRALEPESRAFDFRLAELRVFDFLK